MVRYRLTSLPYFGWERKDDDRDLARRALILLGDRRVLWVHWRYEVPDHCVTSATEVRSGLHDLMASPEASPELLDVLTPLQRLFRGFVTNIELAQRQEQEADKPILFIPGTAAAPPSDDPYEVALRALREGAGEAISLMASKWDLDVPTELSTIVPDDNAWFFQVTESGTTY